MFLVRYKYKFWILFFIHKDYSGNNKTFSVSTQNIVHNIEIQVIFIPLIIVLHIKQYI